jgi:hypothetical protein
MARIGPTSKSPRPASPLQIRIVPPVEKHTYAHRMETLLTNAQAASSKVAISVGWMERSATHQGPADGWDGEGAISAAAGGLHPPYGNAFPDASPSPERAISAAAGGLHPPYGNAFPDASPSPGRAISAARGGLHPPYGNAFPDPSASHDEAGAGTSLRCGTSEEAVVA